MRDMIYQSSRLNPPEQIANGEYNGFNYYVLNLGTHPCAYVDVTETKLKNVEYDRIDIECHGGLTYSEHKLLTVDKEGWFIGWDYAHAGDFAGYDLNYPSIRSPRRIWTTQEIVDECKEVIDQLVVLLKENDVPRYIKLPQPEYLSPTAEELEAFATKLYQSPIEIIMQEMQTQFDGEVFKATQAYGINVDKDELIKALEYDRDQYNKGFADGSRIDTTAIRAEVAREIFEEIEEARKHWESIWKSDHYGSGGGAYGYLETDVDSTIYELKKKYTEGQK